MTNRRGKLLDAGRPLGSRLDEGECSESQRKVGRVPNHYQHEGNLVKQVTNVVHVARVKRSPLAARQKTISKHVLYDWPCVDKSENGSKILPRGFPSGD